MRKHLTAENATAKVTVELSGSELALDHQPLSATEKTIGTYMRTGVGKESYFYCNSCNT